MQAGTNRLPDCPGQSLFGLSAMNNRRIAQLGKFKKLEVSLHQSHQTYYKYQKSCPN